MNPDKITTEKLLEELGVLEHIREGAGKLTDNTKVLEDAKEVACQATKDNYTSGLKPQTVAACSLYAALIGNGLTTNTQGIETKFPQQRVTRVSGAGERAIERNYQKFSQYEKTVQ